MMSEKDNKFNGDEVNVMTCVGVSTARHDKKAVSDARLYCTPTSSFESPNSSSFSHAPRGLLVCNW
jgi:hypothetical protein